MKRCIYAVGWFVVGVMSSGAILRNNIRLLFKRASAHCVLCRDSLRHLAGCKSFKSIMLSKDVEPDV